MVEHLRLKAAELRWVCDAFTAEPPNGRASTSASAMGDAVISASTTANSAVRMSRYPLSNLIEGKELACSKSGGGDCDIDILLRVEDVSESATDNTQRSFWITHVILSAPDRMFSLTAHSHFDTGTGSLDVLTPCVGRLL